MIDTASFYANLPVLENFLDITDTRSFHTVPSDWYVVITDIVGSTKAIESGRYKDVNFLGAASIVAVLNTTKNLEVPFVFGGDGAAILIPPSLFLKARQALLATRQRAKTEFGLDLRVGVVPVSDVTAANYEVKIAKIRVSKNYYQAVFTGDGLSYATQLIKDPTTAELYTYSYIDGDAKADFSSLECRWQDIPSKDGEIVSLIVKVNSSNTETANIFYREIIKKINSIYGGKGGLNPISKENLNLAFSYKYLKSETQLRANSDKFRDKTLYFGKILLENVLGWFLMKFKVKALETDWGVYKDIAIAATDYQKFDDMLRMVIAGNEVQRKKLTRYLENKYQNGEIVYGLHSSDRALMTCVVFERNGSQVHFIDGADGGYAAAAKEMKKRIMMQQRSDTTASIRQHSIQ